MEREDVRGGVVIFSFKTFHNLPQRIRCYMRSLRMKTHSNTVTISKIVTYLFNCHFFFRERMPRHYLYVLFIVGVVFKTVAQAQEIV